jgi:hypothetical protein
MHAAERHDLSERIAAFVELHLCHGRLRHGSMRRRRFDGRLLLEQAHAVSLCSDV